MSFSPFARFRNFTVDNLKALLEVYPDQAKQFTWSEAGEIIESISSGYKKTAYQQACQFGLEDRGNGRFKVQSYLYTFNDDMLEKYMRFWIETYYAPNPYVNSDDEPMLIFCEIAKEILDSPDLRIDYGDFFSRRIGGKSEDILLNALKAYAQPLKYQKVGNNHFLYIEGQDTSYLKERVLLIENEFGIPANNSREEFFERHTYTQFCKFYGITNQGVDEMITESENVRVQRLTGAENILLYGVPGAGKSHKIAKEYCSDSRRIERVVFHPDYTYSDFVGQILPRVVDDKLRYVFTAGPFTKMLKKAWNDPGHHYYLIIEEINRGNAPAIFGEIFQLLDRKELGEYPEDVVGESVYGISNYDVANEVYGDSEHEVLIPSNMFVIATMNTADQNVFTLDTAFQRRWKMEHIPNKFVFEEGKHALDVIQGSAVNWGTFATVVNDVIMEINQDTSSAEDKRLGAYFVKTNELSQEIFAEKVLKYLWDDAFKMDKDAVFDSKFKSLDAIIETYEATEEDRLAAVLRSDLYAKMIKKMREQGNS